MSKKELIRLTAIDLFAAKGFYNTSTPMIAEAAQISIGTVYNYFKNKEEILDYIFSVEYHTREAFLLDLEKAELPIAQKIQAFIDRFFAVIRDNPNCSAVIACNIMNPKNQNLKSIYQFRFGIVEVFTRLIRKAHQNGEIPDINPDLAGPGIYYAIRHLGNTIQPEIGSEEYDMAVQELKDFINNALLGCCKY